MVYQCLYKNPHSDLLVHIEQEENNEKQQPVKYTQSVEGKAIGRAINGFLTRVMKITNIRYL